MNDEEANFCIYCGKKLTNKSFCPECGTEYAGNFCPKCGAGKPAEQQPVKAQKQTKATPPAHIGWRKILEYVAGGLCMAGVFFALLFAFLIGVGVSGTDANVMIYEYFGAAYSDLSESIGTSSYDASALFTMYFPTVMGTLIVVGTLVTVVTLAALSIVRYVKYVLGKSEKDYAGMSAATVLAFLTGAVGFLALHATTVGASAGNISATGSTTFSAATVAGIVLACVFFALFAGCRIAIHAKDIFVQKRLVTLILSCVGMVLLAIALHFTGVGIAKAAYAPSGTTVKFGGGYSVIATIALMNLSHSGTEYFLPDAFVIPSILAFVGMVVQGVLLILLACAIVKFLTNLTTAEEKGNLKFSIVSAVFAVVHLVLVILACTFLIEAHSPSNTAVMNATVSYVYPIVALVFAALSLGVAIAHKIFLKKQHKSELPQENVEEQQVEY